MAHRKRQAEEQPAAGSLWQRTGLVFTSEIGTPLDPRSVLRSINVLTTVNVQQLESLTDVVEQITGVPQRETVPDAVVRRADGSAGGLAHRVPGLPGRGVDRPR